MEDIKQYIITIVSVALLSSVLLKLLNPKSTAYKAVKLMTGILVILTLVSPWTEISLQGYMDYFDAVQQDAIATSEYGEGLVSEELRQSIKENTEAYILDKAALMGAEIQVSVTCDSSDWPIPISVELSGSISPYARTKLQKIISDDVGIPEDKQTWL